MLMRKRRRLISVENSSGKGSSVVTKFRWILANLESASKDPSVHGVVLFLSQPWKAEREFQPSRTLHEKHELAKAVKNLGFNDGNKFFVLVSGDMHMMAYDSGEFNAFGDFPIFHCSSLNSNPSCKQDGWSDDGVFMNRGQFCNFKFIRQSESRTCLLFEGY